MRAYVDESEPGGGRDHTAYVLAAVVIRDDDAARLRTEIRTATPRRMRKLHWYEALRTQRLSWLDLLRSVIEIIVVRFEGAPARAERRRRHCLERLVWELEQRGVPRVVLESRGKVSDDGDRSLFDALRRRGVGRGLRHEHVRAVDEPLVALADVACGAHVAGLDVEIESTIVRVS
jgi:hypothetical protein